MSRAAGILATVIFFVSHLSFAGNAQEILEKVKKKYDTIKDAELAFSQRTKFATSNREQTAKGTLYIKKENKYRVELENATIVTDGMTVWSYTPANKRVLIDRFKNNERSLTPERILAAAPTDYDASISGTEKIGKTEAQVLTLVPKDTNSAVRSMKLWVDPSTWLMKRVEITDVNGKDTIYSVADARINIGIPDSRFTFEVPDGVEAVDLR